VNDLFLEIVIMIQTLEPNDFNEGKFDDESTLGKPA